MINFRRLFFPFVTLVVLLGLLVVVILGIIHYAGLIHSAPKSSGSGISVQSISLSVAKNLSTGLKYNVSNGVKYNVNVFLALSNPYKHHYICFEKFLVNFTLSNKDKKAELESYFNCTPFWITQYNTEIIEMSVPREGLKGGEIWSFRANATGLVFFGDKSCDEGGGYKHLYVSCEVNDKVAEFEAAADATFPGGPRECKTVLS